MLLNWGSLVNKNFLKISFVLFVLVYNIKAHALTYLFSHGLFDSEIQAYRYTKEYQTFFGGIANNPFYIMDGDVKTFSYPDVIGIFSKIPFLSKIPLIYKTSFGQGNELEALRSAYNQIDDDEVILVGVSRGASNILIFMGLDKPERVKGAVLISPFDLVRNVFEYHMVTWLISKITCCDKKTVYKWLKMITCFNEDGVHPIDLVEKIESDVPLLFVCAETDKTVPCKSTISLYEKLVDCGHKKAHLLTLESGKHGKLLYSLEAERFQNVVHAFYQKYDLPYDEKFAQLGVKDFSVC